MNEGLYVTQTAKWSMIKELGNNTQVPVEEIPDQRALP